ncbi:TadE/TadG family type IV pilus assembly protein [Shimia sediminis]|uniref:TadE/TadG family type IV pilus assembly protein n=1 Tax=Shimia sediminis TaxID=2497945 RepID=UPI000F8F0334|nr:TadE/TadG family type IV pilus assembly protein [Shimia sediminis]
MIKFLKQFRRDDTGSAAVEFAVMFPVFFFILLSSVELGMMTIRSALLERALDIVVRDIRLTTGTAPSHTDIRTAVCAETNVVSDCNNNLALEMYLVDPRAWTDIPTAVTCTNKSEEVLPVTAFRNGMDNELMIIRACAKYEPMFADYGLGAFMAKDSSGDAALIAKAAFVQEPR